MLPLSAVCPAYLTLDEAVDITLPLYREIYDRHDRSFFVSLEKKAEEMAKKYDCPFMDNEMPYGRVPQGHPVIVDYFYHEEIRGLRIRENET